MQYFLKNFIEGRRTFVSREYVSTEFHCRQISAMVYRSASDKLAVDSLVLLAFLD